jgi:osmotically-inducible protein OsmY
MSVLQQPATPTAAGVHRCIEDAMYRAARQQLCGIDVRVVDHDVWLEGTTTSATARVRAELAAWSVPGVDNVYNEICVVT